MLNYVVFQGGSTTLYINSIPSWDPTVMNLVNNGEFTVYVVTDRPRTIIIPPSSVFALGFAKINIVDIYNNAATNNITVQRGVSSDTINGGASFTLNVNSQSVQFKLYGPAFNTTMFDTTSGGGGGGSSVLSYTTTQNILNGANTITHNLGKQARVVSFLSGSFNSIGFAWAVDSLAPTNSIIVSNSSGNTVPNVQINLIAF